MRTLGASTWGAPLFAGVLAAATLLLVGGLRLGPDGASYLSLSEHWAAGDWGGAVNGYWSPLLPLLLVPAALIGVSLVAAVQVVGVLTASASIAALQRLMRSVGIDTKRIVVLSFGAAPFAAFAAIDVVGPDLLMAAILVWFIAELLSDDRSIWFVGALGGLAFLAKAYAAPFLAAFIVVLAVLRSSQDVTNGGRGVRNLLGVGAVCSIVIVTWSTAVSFDESRLTFTTASAYNRSVTAPGSPGMPYRWAGLIEPDRPSAFWGWEDPVRLPTARDRPNLAADGIDAQNAGPGRLGRTLDNVDRAYRGTALAAGSVIAATVTAVWAALHQLRSRRRRGPDGDRADADVIREDRRQHRAVDTMAQRALVLSIAAAIYVGGLLILVVEVRYLYFVLLLAVALAGIGLDQCARRWTSRLGTVSLGAALTVAVALTTALRPSVALFRLDERSAYQQSVDAIFDTVPLAGSRVASFPADLVVVGARCFEEGCTYLGAPTTNPVAGTVSEQLQEFHVDLFVVRLNRDITVPPGAIIIARSDEIGYAIYDVSELTDG